MTKKQQTRDAAWAFHCVSKLQTPIVVLAGLSSAVIHLATAMEEGSESDALYAVGSQLRDFVDHIEEQNNALFSALNKYAFPHRDKPLSATPDAETIAEFEAVVDRWKRERTEIERKGEDQ